VRREVSRIDAQLPVHNIARMEEIVADGQGPRRLAVMLLGWFAGMALLLVIIGVYGVMAYSVGCRTHEMGLRMALGALPREIARLVVAQAARITLLGIGLGIAAALVLTRLMTGLLYGVSAHDPLTLGGVACVLWAVGLAACYVPVRRATRVDPMVALRHE